MMSLFHNIPFRRILPGFLLLLFAFSCRQEDSNELPTPGRPGSGETAEITLSLQIPGFQAANTRAGVDESTVHELTVLLFAEEGGTEVVKVKKELSSDSWRQESFVTGTVVVIRVPVTTAGTYKRIAIVANANTELSAIVVGSTYNSLTQVEVTGRHGTTGAPSDKYIPMYGEYLPTGGIQFKEGISQVIAQEIPLIRMMARVDIINPLNSGGMTEAPIGFINTVDNGRVWVDPTTYNAGATQSGYMAPTLPATLLPGFGNDPIWVPVKARPNVLTYYLNEQPATSTVLTTYGNGRPCILIPLVYEGRGYYYRIDYTWDGVKGGGVAPYQKGAYMPILRNHRYIFTIKEVKGPGFLTPEEALTSAENFTNSNNIVVVPAVIDESFTDVVFNDQGYFLATTRTEMTLKGAHDATSTQNRFTVQTNYPGGFRIGAYDSNGTLLLPSANPWLRPSQSVGATGATLTNPVSQEVQAITNGRGFEDGCLEVRAGRLYTKVNVKQIGKVPLDYVAEYNLAGGSQYGTSPSNYSPTSAHTDPQLRWASNHDNDQSGFYNWYVLRGVTESTYNPSGKDLFSDSFFTTGAGKGYHLPSYWEWTSIFSYDDHAKYGSSVNHSNIIEACEFGGIKKTFASDYYSAGDGVCYALRFKAAPTGSTPNDGSSLSDFPLATDNSMLCAYRYTRVGTFTNGSLDSRLKVDCVHLGNSFTGDISTIDDSVWWNTHASETTTRNFPAVGYIYQALVSGSDVNSLRGNSGWYWSASDGTITAARRLYFESGYSTSRYYFAKSTGFVVRLFADE